MGPGHVLCMRANRQFLSPALLIVFVLTLSARGAAPAQLLRAQQLSDQGQSRAAIAILEPLVREESHVLDEANRGVAWSLLGSAYKDFEDYDKARRCYETAIHILGAFPNEQVQYASAIDNLGSVEESMGHFDSAKALRTKARGLYEAAGDHAGVAIAWSNLAQVALDQHDLPRAKKNMTEAFREAQLTKALSSNNLAAMYTVEGGLARTERDFRGAIAADQQAIDIWTRSHGPKFYMLGVAYAMRGEAYGSVADHQQAISDLRHALELLEETPGRYAPAYLTVELAYAHALRDAGSRQEATRLEKEAKAGFTSVRVQQCGGCTISAESFR